MRKLLFVLLLSASNAPTATFAQESADNACFDPDVIVTAHQVVLSERAEVTSQYQDSRGDTVTVISTPAGERPYGCGGSCLPLWVPGRGCEGVARGCQVNGTGTKVLTCTCSTAVAEEFCDNCKFQ